MQLWNYFRLSVENQSNEQTNTPYGVNGKRRIWSLFWNMYVCMLASGRGGVGGEDSGFQVDRDDRMGPKIKTPQNP